MNTDFERDVSAALHHVADELPPPQLDLGVIRRGGRRRRVAAFTAAALATAVVAGGVVAGVLELPSVRVPGPVRPAASATQPTSTPTANTTPTPTPTSMSTQADSPALANVEAFYAGCQAAEQQGQAGIDALITTHAASWYAPILEAFTEHGYAGCIADPLGYAAAGQIGGQAIIVVTSSDAAQVSYTIVTADQDTGLVTGIASTYAGQAATTAANASSYASNFYYVGSDSWLTLRRQGDSPQQAVARILGVGAYAGWGGGPEDASPYLSGLQRAAPWPELTYDPLLCTSSGLPSVSVTDAIVVADGEAGVVELTPGQDPPIVAVWVLGAQGYAVGSVACHQP
jgi:hypothetical protein